MSFTTVKVAGEDALRALDEYRARYARTGLYPFLIGDAKAVDDLRESVEDEEFEPGAILRASADVDVAGWMERRRTQFAEDGFEPEEESGEWPPDGEVGRTPIVLHRDISEGKPLREVHIGLTPIAEPWHLPAALNYGGWNDCPRPEVQCAFHRDWLHRFGSEIIGVSNSVIQTRVARPPASREAAMALAREQYWFCGDIVEQGCGTVAALASTLLDWDVWYFWWD